MLHLIITISSQLYLICRWSVEEVFLPASLPIILFSSGIKLWQLLKRCQVVSLIRFQILILTFAFFITSAAQEFWCASQSYHAYANHMHIICYSKSNPTNLYPIWQALAIEWKAHGGLHADKCQLQVPHRELWIPELGKMFTGWWTHSLQLHSFNIIFHTWCHRCVKARTSASSSGSSSALYGTSGASAVGESLMSLSLLLWLWLCLCARGSF